jgi:C4-dicarboxylate-specific signal transduction histidine kinase
MSVVPLKSRQGGAVVTHTDITSRKRAELEAQRSRDELAHTTRVWTMGELTASLSHQLNQPLTGIMGNASAGRRLLEANPANVREAHQIFTDIIADTQRASDVICAIREMLGKDTSEYELLDVNDIVRDTTVLVTSEAVIRSVSLRLDLAPSLPLVRARRVQLRQVMLNLVMNAIEAVIESEDPTEKVALVRTGVTEGAGIHVSVADTGCGLPDGGTERIFEPLFTTKSSGMGMGLPIARAIVEAHGGRMWAAKADTGGAVVHFTVPVSHDVPTGH